MEPRPIDEAATTASLGLEYVNVPVGPHSLTDATLDRVRDVLRDAGDSLVLFNSGKNQDAAWKWIEFLSKPENMAEWTYKSEGTLLPPRTSLLESPDLVKSKPVLKGFADLMKCGVNYNITDKQWPKITDELNTQLGNAMFGKVTPAQALDNTAAEAEKLRSR